MQNNHPVSIFQNINTIFLSTLTLHLHILIYQGRHKWISAFQKTSLNNFDVIQPNHYVTENSYCSPHDSQ